MNIFKNGVGRPSNKAIRKRKIVVYSLVLALVLAFGTTILLVNNKNKNELQSAIINKSSKSKFAKCIIEEYNTMTKKNKKLLLNLFDSDLKKFKSLVCQGKDIDTIETKYMKGFVNLEWISLNSNKIKSIDLSSNKSLKKLWISNNKLSSINLDTNINLVEVEISNNNLKSINLSKNSNLETFKAENNRLESIDVHRNLNLKKLYLSNNKLSKIDVTYNKKLEVLTIDGNTNIQGLNISNNPKLTFLMCNLPKDKIIFGNKEIVTSHKSGKVYYYTLKAK